MGWGRRPEGTEVSGACCRLSVCGWHDAGHWRHEEGEKQEASPRLRARGHAAASSGEEADGGTLERRLSLKWKCSPEPACPQRRHSRSLFPRSPGPSPAHIDAGILAGACPKGRGRACSVWGPQGELDGRRFGGRGTGGAHGRAAAAGCPGAQTGTAGCSGTGGARGLTQDGPGRLGLLSRHRLRARVPRRQRSLVCPHGQLSDGTAPCFFKCTGQFFIVHNAPSTAG